MNGEDHACDGWPTKNNQDSSVMLLTITFDCNGGRRMYDETSTNFAAVLEPSEEMEELPYCVSEDYPCEGEGENMVHVCHYSPQKGYQTFCIPEVESDILRHYPNDYCGPCVGNSDT